VSVQEPGYIPGFCTLGPTAVDVVLAQVFKVAPDGRWFKYWALADDQDGLDEFWS
jgi:hypothetical protein